MKATATKEMKTLIINGKLEAAGDQKSLLRAATRIIKKKKLKNPSVYLIENIIFELEKNVP